MVKSFRLKFSRFFHYFIFHIQIFGEYVDHDRVCFLEQV